MGERWPEPVTPFSWSTGYAMIQQNMDETLAGLKAPYAGKIQWAKRAYGHVYLNEGALTHAYNDGLGMPMGMIAPSMTGVIPVTPENNRYQWSKMLRHAGFFLGSFTQWENNVKRLRRRLRQDRRLGGRVHGTRSERSVRPGTVAGGGRSVVGARHALYARPQQRDLAVADSV